MNHTEVALSLRFRGFRRRDKRKAHAQRTAVAQRPLLLELLEYRILRSTANLSNAGLLTYTAATGVANNLTISVAGGIYTLNDTGELISLSGRANSRCTGGGTNTITCSDSDISSISLIAGDMNDVVAIQSANDPTTVLGGAGSDTVTIFQNGLAAALSVSDTGTTGTDTFTSKSSAAVPETIGISAVAVTRSSGGTITYSGQESLVVTGSSAADLITVTGTSAATAIDGLSGADSVAVTQNAVSS